MTDGEKPLRSPGPGVGERLTRARRDRGMSIEDVAQAMRLSPRHVAALEEERFDDLHGATYVRGYLRNYARLVGLPVDEVLAAYSPQEADAAAVRPIGRPLQREVRSTDRPIRAITFLIVAVLAVLLVVWWQGQRADPVRLRTGAPADAPAAADTSADAPAGNGGGLPAGALPPDPAGQETSADAAPPPADGGEPDETGGGAQSGADQPAGMDATDAGAAGAGPATVADAGTAEAAPAEAGESPSNTLAGAPPDGDAAPAAEQAAEQAAGRRDTGAAAPGVTRLTLRYDEACWTDIRDARGERLVYRTVPAGETIAVEGVAPLRVFFGNAQGVRLEVAGQPFDFSSSVRGVFARFSVQAGSAAR